MTKGSSGPVFFNPFRVMDPFINQMRGIAPFPREKSHKHNFACNVLHLLRFNCLIHICDIQNFKSKSSKRNILL